MAALDERLDKAEEMIAKPSFRENKGLGNEVGYYIFDYMPKDELIVRKRVEYIRQKHEDSPDGFKVVVFDLYDITIEILKEKGYLEKCFDLEKNKGLDRVIRAVGNTLRLTGDDNLIVKYNRDRKVLSPHSFAYCSEQSSSGIGQRSCGYVLSRKI